MNRQNRQTQTFNLYAIGWFVCLSKENRNKISFAVFDSCLTTNAKMERRTFCFFFVGNLFGSSAFIIDTTITIDECNTSPVFPIISIPSLSQAICTEKSHTSNTFDNAECVLALAACNVVTYACIGFKMQTEYRALQHTHITQT